MRTRPWHICWSCVALTAAVSSGCGGGDATCEKHASRYCERGAVYWVDGCGRLAEVDSYCACGCTDDHAGCRTDCGCTCSEPGPCCDGCLPAGEGLSCDDEDPDTLADVCRAGVCAGFAPGALAQAASPEEPAAPTAAAPPADVRLVSWACPSNWEPVEHAELIDNDGNPFSWCRPPPLPRLKLGAYVTPLKEGEQEGDRPVCDPAADGTFPLVGHAGCQPLGDACPAGDWPEVPADVPGARVHARAGASGGDGSPAAPFGTIAEAVAAAAEGDVVVIAGGSYPESLTIDKHLTLWGACARDTLIAPPGPYDAATAAVQVVQDRHVELRNLRIGGEQQGVRVDAAGAELTLRGVWIHGAAGNGVDVAQGTARLAGCLVTATRAAGDFYGLGLRTAAGAVANIQACTFERNRDVAFSAYGAGTELSAADVASRETLPREADGDYGIGMEVLHGARATVTRALFERNRWVGVLAAYEGSVLTLEQAVVRATRPDEDSGEYGGGVSIELGAGATLQDVLIDANHAVGLTVYAQPTTLDAENLVVRATRPRASDANFGRGVEVYDGGEARIANALIEDNHDVGLVVFDPGSRVDMQDVAVVGTESLASNQTLGYGMALGFESEITMQRGLIDGNRSTGVAVFNDAVAELEDLTVRDTRSQESNDGFGHGLDADSGAQVTVRRGLFERNRSTAILAVRVSTRLTLEDIAVTDTRSRASDGTAGRGLDAAAGAEVVLRRVRFEDNRDVGLYVRNPDTVLEAEDLLVSDTLGRESDQAYGYGMEIGHGARTTVTRAVFDRNSSLGLFVLGEDTLAEFADLVVRDTQEDAADQKWGRGIEVNGGARAEIRRAVFEGNRDFGVFASQPGTVLAIEDTTIRGTRGRALDGAYGIGLEVLDEARLEGARLLLDGNRFVGLAISDPDTRVLAEDVVVRGTLPTDKAAEAGAYGAGVVVINGGHLSLARGLLDQNHMVGLLATDNRPTVELEDLVVRDTRSQESDGLFGWGLAAQLGADVRLVRGLLEDNREVAANCLGEDARMELTHVVVRGTQAAACAGQPEPCEDQPRGLGLGVYLEGRTVIDGVVIESSDLLGIQVAEKGALSGKALTVQDNPIGVNVQDPADGWSFFGQVSGLRMSGNGVNFDGSDLPIPDPLSVLQ